jgi:Cd(II)/Pb(II)-responsive transcriptional regulator
MATFKIGELARLTHCPVETIRYYERLSLLPAPERSENNYRVYNQTHVERLQFIRHCRSLDMTLDEVRDLLVFRETPAENCRQVDGLLDKHIAHVSQRIAELQALQQQLGELRALCDSHQSMDQCGILLGLAQMPDDPRPVNLGSHQGGCH